MDEKNGIGKDNHLPWYLHSDLQRFKSLTMEHHLVMGRKTYESIGKPLPGRTMVVVTNAKSFHPEGCLVVNSIDEAIRIAENNHETEIFIIGGGQVFAQSIGRADKIYLTKVHTVSNADVFFPYIDASRWTLVSSEETINHEKDEYKSTFQILQRKRLGAEN